MRKAKILALTILLSLVYQFCIVSAPKYTHVEKVLVLKPGMTQKEVNDTLGIGPYDINYSDSTGNHSLIYKYRVTDRKTVPFLLRETNGVKSKGKYMDLIAFYDSSDVAYAFQSKYSDSRINERRLDFNKVLTAITITAPSVLVYLGITKD